MKKLGFFAAIGVVALALPVPAAWAAEPQFEHVMNIGTAGALRDDVTGLHEIGTAINHDLSAEPIRQLGLDPREVVELPGGHATVPASGDLFVTDPVVRSALAQRAHLVDMEGYAIALACTELGVPVHLVKVVSDNADETAHDWSAAVDGCARLLGDWLGGFAARH